MSTTSPPAPDPVLDGVDVEAVEARFRQALADGEPGDLEIVGYGEISVAFAWPRDLPTVAIRALPVFDRLARLEAYGALVDEYVAALRQRGVDVVPTAVRWARAPRGWRGYLVQPLLSPATIGPRVLAHGGSGDPMQLLRTLVGHVNRVIDERVGLDAQVSNWAVVDGHARYLDVGTPMLRDGAGRDRLDVAILATAVPRPLRGLVTRRVAPELLAPYHDRRRAILDTAGNLIREDLAAWIPPLLELANPHLATPLTVPQVRRFYRGNAMVFASLQAMRRADRAWSRRIRHRGYPFLLPDHYDR